MKPTTLLLRIRLMFSAVLSGMGIVVCLCVWLLGRSAVQQQVQRDVATASGYLEDYIEHERKALALNARLAAQDPKLLAAIKESPAAIVRYLDQLGTSSGIDGFAVRNAEGRICATSGKVPKGLLSIRPGQIQKLGELNEASWPNGLAAYPGGFMLRSPVPVKNENGKTIAMLTCFTVVGKSQARNVAKTLGIEIAFIYGAMVASASMPTPDQLPNDGDFHIENIGGENYGMKYVVLQENDWEGQIGVMVLRSVAQATVVHRQLMILFALLTIGSLAAGVGAAGQMAKGIVKPIEQVVAAAVEVQQGRWPDVLKVTSNDEVGVLQQAFNGMTASMRASEERLLTLIDTDALTDLLNHRAFKQKLAESMATCQVGSLLLVDIDNFKDYNDEFGHAQGDAVLRAVSDSLRACLPSVAVLGRLGGEELCAFLPGITPEIGADAAEALRASLVRLNVGVTVSVGVAFVSPSTTKPDSLIMAAELAVSQAKSLGRDRVCRFDMLPGADADTDPYELHKFLQDASLSTIQALAAAVDAKDAYTQGHSQRVAAYAADLARFVGRNRADVDLIFKTGTLHDVGKIGVPDSILKKPGRLTDEEREIMESHPVLGEIIVRKAPQLEDTLPGVRHHHERWDGQGYPDGLRGTRIPFVARVLAIADTFDAMTSDRPYRKGMPVSEALDAIEKGSGTQFDPELAPAFVMMMGESDWRLAA